MKTNGNTCKILKPPNITFSTLNQKLLPKKSLELDKFPHSEGSCGTVEDSAQWVMGNATPAIQKKAPQAGEGIL
jgi:hypothetical protein